MPPPKHYTQVSPLWFFAKLAVLCLLGVFVLAQVYLLLWDVESTVPRVSPLVATASDKDEMPEKQWDVIVNPPGTIAPPVMPEQPASKKQAAKPSKPPPKPSLQQALTDPEKFAMIKSEFIRRLDVPYGKLYRQLNLDPDILQQLRGLLAEKELTMVEGYELSKGSNKPLDSNSLAALRDDVDGDIRELLGDDAYATYKEYENTLPARNQATALEDFLACRSDPLTSEQYNALVSALSNVPDADIKSGAGAWMGNYLPDITEGSLEVIRNILTPSQLAAYESACENMLLGDKLEEKYSQDNPVPQMKAARNKEKN